jgi:ABC-type phosphate transport system substrate-binding protein
MKTLLVLAVLMAVTAAAAEPPAFIVIVNAANAAALTRQEIANVFLKRVTRWPGGGGAIAVVDALPDSPVRDDFSRSVLHRGTTAVEAYWQQQIFSGRDVPPVQKESDADIVAFVRNNRGGIGYVAAGTPLDGVRAVTWTREQ